MKKLLKKLDKLHSCADERLQGENPACDRILASIKSKLEGMEKEDVIKQLSKLGQSQLEQILPLLEDMVDDNSAIQEYIDKAMN